MSIRMGDRLDSRRAAAWAAVGAVALWAGAAWGQGYGLPRRPLHQRVDLGVEAAVRYLSAQIDEKGMCRSEYKPENIRYGGQTALCVYALLSAAEGRASGAAARGLAWLQAASLRGTYAVAMRACAYGEVRDDKILPWLKQDVEWLIKAAARDGSYTYESAGGREVRTYDNSNSQMAVLGVRAGAHRGIEVAAQYWRTVEKHWLAQQQDDGGWPYLVHEKLPQAHTYGSMTAAGLATLYICYDVLRRDEFVRCTSASEYKPIVKALGWLTRNYSIQYNPRKGVNWYYYWLYCLERAGLASGRKYFGGKNWFHQGAEELLTIQKGDGSWGHGPLATAQTAFGLLFLVRGRNPVLLNTLRYPGQWNARPRDASNLSRFVSVDFERSVTWQVVEADSPLADWHDAPLMYISGAGECTLSDPQVARLRTFVYQGGTILSESACNSATFTLAMEGIYKRMFPRYKFERLPDDHPIYTLYYKPKNITGLWGVSNGVRLLAIHAPREISLALQLGPRLGQKLWFELAANMYLYSTDRGRLRPRGLQYWPNEVPFAPAAALRVTRLEYSGNYDPEPLAWERMVRLAGQRYRVKLVVDPPAPMTGLDPLKSRVAVMTGTGPFVLSAAEGAALKRFVEAGGTLVVDAAGGSREFLQALNEQVFALFPGKFVRPLASHVARTGPAKLPKELYRSDYAASLGKAQASEPQLWGMMLSGRPGIILSRADLTAGLVGYPSYRLRGYAPAAAVAVMTNLLCQSVGYRGPQPPTTRPAARPAPKPAPPVTTPPTPPAPKPPSKPPVPDIPGPEFKPPIPATQP